MELTYGAIELLRQQWHVERCRVVPAAGGMSALDWGPGRVDGYPLSGGRAAQRPFDDDGRLKG